MTRDLFDLTAELLFRDVYDGNSFFTPIKDIQKIQYPVDIIETEKGLRIDIAAQGLDKEDININTKGNELSVCYNKEKKDTSNGYVQRNITRKSFNHTWKVPTEYDIGKIAAGLDKGILSIEVPFAKSKEPKTIKIQ